MKPAYDYKKGLAAMAVTYLIWGFMPLYYAIDPGIDTLFLLASRTFWAAAGCILILKLQGTLPELRRVFTEKRILLKEIPASILLFGDWSIYLFAVRQGKVMECAMGYYIMPLVMFAFGALVFKEKILPRHLACLGLIAVGIVLSIGGFGGFPFVTVALSLCFAVYSALKKTIPIDSIVTTTAEIILMIPMSILFFLFTGGTASELSFGRILFLLGSGLVTGIPMVSYSVGLSCLPLQLTGILTYLSPTLGFISGLLLGETLTREKLISFLFIWAGVILYGVFEYRRTREAVMAPEE